ncbi:MAG: hypothetical protein GXO82_03590 [Chlorobi bacterium]|nr:hypothetical protein [Chlorobiota bacterium]
MTIFEMMHQVSLFVNGTYERRGEIGVVDIPLPDGRHQLVMGKVNRYEDDAIGILYTVIGKMNKSIDPLPLLRLNQVLRYSKITLEESGDIIVSANFEITHTSIAECTPIVQEIAAFSDLLESVLFEADRT